MKRPILTILLIILNIFLYLLTLICGTDFMFNLFGMYQGATLNYEGYRIITSAFIHGGIIHLINNMICLYYFGRILEANISRFKYFIICIISIITSGWCINLFGGNALHGGASGLVFGLLGATFILEYKNNMDYSNTLKGLIINLILSFSVGISWQGHVGGLIGGLLISLWLCKNINTLSFKQWKKLHPKCSAEYYYK